MKVNLGSSQLKKSFFPNSFDSSTSLNFGECVPQFCKHVAPNTHVNLDVRSGVRLAPLSLPTFGKAYLKSYYFYNRLSDIYPPFDNLLTQTTFTSSYGTSYVPTEIPNIPLSLLWAIVLSNSTVTYYKTASAPAPIDFGSDSVLNYCDFKLLPLSDTDVDNFSDSSGQFLLDPLTDILFSQRGQSNDIAGLKNGTFLDHPLGSNCRVVQSSQQDFVEIGSADFLLTGIRVDSSYRYDNKKFVSNGFSATDAKFRNYPYYNIAIRLNDSGKFLRKLFMGLGYQIGNFGTRVSVLPLIAYYYNYFDTFAPKRFVQLVDTNAYKLVNIVVQNNTSFLNAFYYSGPIGSGNSAVRSLGKDFVDDLCGCFYTEDTDYYTSQILGQINDFGGHIQQSYLGHDYYSDSPVTLTVEGDPGTSSTGFFAFSTDEVQNGSNMANTHQQAQQNVLSRLTEFLNIRSLVGGEIAETLKAVYGLDVKDVLDAHRTYIGSSSVDVEFSDVFSTAETAEGSLGEYAGKALGFGSNGELNVDCPVEGFVICFATVVPRTQYVDGVDPCLFHRHQSDFYNPKFDGLTLLPTRALSLYAHDVLGYGDSLSNADNHSFGNAPIYNEYKTRTQGVLNGDLSLRSTQASYDSFTMDKVIANEPYLVLGDGSSVTGYNVIFVEPDIAKMTCGTQWRYLGRWLWYGRFDRIFVNAREIFSNYDVDSWQSFFNAFLTRQSYRTDDNLIVHNIVDMKLNSAMLPLADSYMTKDLYELENGKGVRANAQ